MFRLALFGIAEFSFGGLSLLLYRNLRLCRHFNHIFINPFSLIFYVFWQSLILFGAPNRLRGLNDSHSIMSRLLRLWKCLFERMLKQHFRRLLRCFRWLSVDFLFAYILCFRIAWCCCNYTFALLPTFTFKWPITFDLDRCYVLLPIFHVPCRFTFHLDLSLLNLRCE